MVSSSYSKRHMLIIEDQQGRRTITLEDVKYSLGRKADNQIVIYSKQASRQHATLVKKVIDRDNFSYWILDGDLEGNKSHNGIYINGTKCLVHELKDGDLINFGCEVNASYHTFSGNMPIAADNNISHLTTSSGRNQTLDGPEETPQPVGPNQVSTFLLDDAPIINPEDTLQDQELTDNLTGLPNQSLFKEYLSIAINNSQRSGKILGVLLFDIDKLVNINNRYGHRVGDEIINEFGQRLKSSLRAGDIVSRWGGDEFIILLPNLNNPRDIINIKQRIFKIAEPIYTVEKHSIAVESSVAAALYPQDAADGSILLRKLEKNLEQVKKENQQSKIQKKDQVDAKATKTFKVESLLQKAIQQNELSLYYQPQVNILKGMVDGLEVLLRWQHPQLGMIAPGRFLPVLEETDSIIILNRWVLHKACVQAKEWLEKDLLRASVSINVSPRQFHHPDFVKTLAGVLDSTRLQAKYLEIEMTETSLMTNVEETCRIIHELNQLGVSLAVDDFGVGTVSIGYLSQLPLKKLKIAQTLIKNLLKNPDDVGLISAAIALGKSFNLTVVAEGVEDEQQLAILQKLGCERMQGNSISPPLPVTETSKFLSIHRTLSGMA